MFGTLRTLMVGANARAEERVRDTYAIELIEQKIREATASLQAAKGTLASLIQRHRAEQKQVQAVENRIADLTKRAEAALKDDNEIMAAEAANAIATLENELEGRRQTVARLDQRIAQLRHSVETGHRQIVDLKQGLVSARAVRHEQNIQSKLNTTIKSGSAVQEAEELIAQVMGREDPFEQAQILSDIDRGLSQDTLADRMSDAGYGDATRTTGADVLKRLKSKK
ncbi:MAG: PspA/IM30 family protein [Pseudomonadota bacterium]